MGLNSADFSIFRTEESPIPHDIVFILQEENGAEQQQLKAHRQFLSVVSPVFQKTFYGSFGAPSDPMLIQDSTPQAFSLMLDYVYRGELVMDLFNQTRLSDPGTVLSLLQLLTLADRFMMERLVSICETALVRGVYVTADNLYSIARNGRDYSIFSAVSNSLLSKCANFLKSEVARNFSILSAFKKDDFELFQTMVSLGEEGTVEDAEDDFWGWGGVFPLEELPHEDESVQELSVESTARQKGVVSCRTRLADVMKELTCFCSYDSYSRTKGEDKLQLCVIEIFQKYMLKNSEPFLFYCSVPPYTRKLFGGTEEASGFLNIEWAEFVHVILLRGSISCIVSTSLVRMEEGDIVRFDTVNTAGLWNPGLRAAELLVIAHE